jgi:hypothetical protein
MTVFMKALLGISAFALALRAPLIVAGPTAADYQAAIREATELYRGDCTETMLTEHFYFYGSFSRDLSAKYLRAFEDCEFIRNLLHAFTPNQPMPPTATRTAFRFFDNRNTSTTIQPRSQ